MFSIFLKDLKEHLFIIFLSILLPFFVPFVSKTFFKYSYEDANFILYLILFFLFLPIYVIILSSTIFKNENLKFLKIIPLSFNKIISSKLIFIILNYIILTITYSSFLDFEKMKLEKYEIYIFFILHIYIVLILSFLSFSFSNFLKTNTSNFLTFLIFFVNLLAIIFAFKRIQAYFLINYEVFIFYIILFIFSIFLLYFSSKILYFTKRISAFQKFLYIFIFFIPSIYIYIKIPDWSKDLIISHYEKYLINEDEILIKYSNDIYFYNLKNRKLKTATNLTGLDIIYPEGDKLYLCGNESSCNFCNIKSKCSIYYVFNIKDKSLNKIGVYPLWAHFIDKVVVWRNWVEKEGNNDHFISFKNEKNNLCFNDLAKSSTFLKDGILYKKFEEGEYKIFYVDYEKGEKKEVLKGDLDLYSNWFFFYRYKFYYTFNNNYTYLYKDKNYYRLFPPNGNLSDMGNLRPLVEFDGGYLLAVEEKKDIIILKLFKGEKIIKEENKNWKDLWCYGYNFSNKYAIISFRDKENKNFSAIISIENDDIKIYNLPEDSYYVFFLKNDGEVIITKQKKLFFLKELEYPKAYLYNFKTGKEESL